MEIIDQENQNRAIRLSVPGGYDTCKQISPH